MANEAVLVVETERPINFTCADGTGIEKGALLKLTDPMTAIINSGANDAFAGIAANEKIASDGTTSIATYRGGIFRMTSAGAIAVGDAVTISATTNKVQTATAASVASSIIGVALEATSGADETLLVEVRPGFNNKAYS